MAGRVTGHVSLYQGKRGSVWYMKYRLADGTQKQVRIGPAWTKRGRPPVGHFTEEMALGQLGETLKRADGGEFDRSGKTFGDACAEWLAYLELEKDRRPSTLRDYRNVVNGTLLPAFGRDTPLEEITTKGINDYKSVQLREKRLSPRTIQKVLVLLHGVLKRARANEWIKTNPAENAQRVTFKRSGDFNVLSQVEVMAIVRAAESEQDAALFTVAAFTGLRLGELRALRWQDVDFANPTVFVRGSYTSGNAGPPKSGKIRSVPMADQAAKALDGLSRRQLFTAPEDLVFCSPTGDYINADALRDRFYDALVAAGLGDKRSAEKPIVFHDLRHTFGTLAVEAAPLHNVQAWMGHADIQTTMIYVHHQPKAEDARKLTEAFSKGVGAEALSPDLSRTPEFDRN